MAARRRAAAKPAEEAIEELDDLEEITEDDGDALEELEEEPTPTPAKRTRAKATTAKATPAKAATKAAAPASDRSEFDSNWLAAHVTEETGIEYDSRAVRMLLRKLAKDGQLSREIGEDRSRYDFPKGANDPTVKRVIALIKSGEAKAVKQEGLETAKASAAKKAAPAKATKAATKSAPPAKATTTRRRRTTVAE